MATSGTTNFQATRDQIITAALRKVAALAEDETPSAAMLNNGVFMLETIIKEAHVDGMPLWAIEEQNIPASSFVNGSYTFTSNVPLKVLYAFYRQDVSSAAPIDIPMFPLTRFDYTRLSNKYDLGTPVQYHHDPEINSGVLNVWPIPDTYSVAHGAVYVTYQRMFEDAGNATATLDFPSYWNLCLIYLLAWALCPEFGVPPLDRTQMMKEAEFFRERALSFGTEEGSVFLAPDKRLMEGGRHV